MNGHPLPWLLAALVRTQERKYIYACIVRARILRFRWPSRHMTLHYRAFISNKTSRVHLNTDAALLPENTT